MTKLKKNSKKSKKVKTSKYSDKECIEILELLLGKVKTLIKIKHDLALINIGNEI